MIQNIKHPYFITLIALAFFAYIGTLLQTWDFSGHYNLNTPLVTTWVLGALLLLGLMFTTQNNPHMAKSILWWAVSIIISLLALPMVDYPVASLIGVPLNNMGIIQNIAGIAIAYSVYKICLDNDKGKNIIIAIAVLSLFVFTIATIMTTNDMGATAFSVWLDVHALMAMPSLVIFAVGLYQSEKWVKYLSVVGIIIALFNIVLSKNMTAQALLMVLPIVIGGLYAIDKLFPNKSTSIKATLNPLAILVTTGVVMLAIFLLPYLEYSSKKQILHTMTQRALLLNTYFFAAYYDIASLFTGFGWGSMRDIQMNYGALASGVFETEHRVYPTLHDPRAIIVGGLGSTSLHNIFLDLMASIGVFGAIAFLFMLYHLGRACANHHIVLGTWIVLGAFYSFWFSTSVTVVPFLVAIGITAAILPKAEDETCPQAEKIATATVQKTICICGAILLLLGAFYKVKQTNLLSKTIIERKIAPELYYDNLYNQDHTNFQQSIKFFRKQINHGLRPLVNSQPLSNAQLLIMIDTLDLLKEKSDKGHPRMTAEFLYIINLIMEQGEEEHMLKARQRYFPLWEGALKRAVIETPYRSFLWRTYLQTMYQSEQYQMVGNMAQYILTNGNPNDPMALYYRGLAFRALGDEQSAQTDIRSALDYGITSILPNARKSLKP